MPHARTALRIVFHPLPSTPTNLNEPLHTPWTPMYRGMKLVPLYFTVEIADVTTSTGQFNSRKLPFLQEVLRSFSFFFPLPAGNATPDLTQAHKRPCEKALLSENLSGPASELLRPVLHGDVKLQKYVKGPSLHPPYPTS